MKFTRITQVCFLCLGLSILCCSEIFAQQSSLDVVHLKEGGVLKGTILPNSTAEEIDLQLAGGAILNIQMTRIAEITVENVVQQHIRPPRDRSWEPKKKGYATYNHTTFSFGQSQWGDTQVGFSASTAHGYQFCRHISVAGGIGVDTYPNYSEVFYPVYGRVGGDVLKKKITPIWFIEAGYAFARDSFDEWTTLEGGLRTHSGLGVKFYLTEKVNLMMALGFRYQKSTLTNTWDDENFFETKREFQRTTFGIGMGF